MAKKTKNYIVIFPFLKKLIFVGHIKLKNDRKINSYNFTKGRISRGVSRIAIPSCLENVCWNLDALVEVYWIGRLGGAEYLAAVSLAFMIIFFLRAVGFGFRTAGSALVAQKIGSGDDLGAKFAAAQTILLAFIYYLCVSILGFVFSPFLMSLLTEDAKVLSLGISYLQTSFLFFAFVDGIFTIGHQFRASGEPRFSLYGQLCSPIISFFSVPFFIHGFSGFSGLGLCGGAIGVGTGRLIGVSLMFFIILTGRSKISFGIKEIYPNFQLICQIVKIGWPAATQNLLERGSSLILLKILSIFGPVYLAAWTVGNRISLLARNPSFGIQAALRTMVGQNIGAKKFDRATDSVKFSLLVLIVLMGSIAFLLFIFAENLSKFFGLKDDLSIKVATLSLRILSVGLFFEAIFRMILGAFHGAANTKPPMIVEFFTRWFVQIPAAYIISIVLAFGGSGVWFAMSGGQILSCVFLLLWYYFWIKKKGIGSYSILKNKEL